MEHVQITKQLRLERAILIGAFAGWNDAASAATWAVKFLVNHWDAQPFAEIDPEEFYDFTEARPTVRISGGALRRLSWPSNRFYVYRPKQSGKSDALDRLMGLASGNGHSRNGHSSPHKGDETPKLLTPTDLPDTISARSDVTPITPITPQTAEEKQAVLQESGPRDVILLLGEEPHLRWRTFANEIVALCKELHVEEVVLLGSLVAEVPHTAPVQISGVTSRSHLLSRLQEANVERANYSGPTGMLTALQDAARKEGIATTSLWGSAPHYVSATPNLPVSEALLRKLNSLYSLDLRLGELTHAAQRFTRRVSTLVAEDPDVSAYVRELEQRTSSSGGRSPFNEGSFSDASGIHRIPMDGELPSPEEAVQDVEDWLRRFRANGAD